MLPRVLFAYDLSDNVQLNAQASEGFRLGGINDPLNQGLCSPEDLITFGGRDSFDSETLWNYEVGSKMSFADGRGQFNIAAFYAEIEDLQMPVVAGTCSSRIVFNVPKAHSTGVELELSAAPTDRFDFGISASYTESELDSSVTSTNGGITTIVAGIEEGNRLPSVPELQVSANATYSWPMGDTVNGFITGVYQHVGSRYTQIADQADGFGTLRGIRGFGDPTITEFTFDPLLPAYDIGNLRVGVRGDDWEAALFANNVTDENALLGLDQERGRVARVGLPGEPAADLRHLVPQGFRPRRAGRCAAAAARRLLHRCPRRRRPRRRLRATRTRMASRMTRIVARHDARRCRGRRNRLLQGSHVARRRCSSSIRRR